MSMAKSSLGIFLLSGSLLAACSSVAPPREQLGAAEVALRQAQASAAPQHAPAELRMAADKFAAAQSAMRRGEYEQARRHAEQALVDAQLAETKARTTEAQQMVRQMRASIESLKREAERGSK